MERTEGNKQAGGGLRIRRLNLILGCFAALLAVILIVSTVYMLHSYRETEEANERYIQAQQNAAALQKGSDYLTDRVRTFVITGDPQAAADFFEEVEVTQRRDRALEDMQALFSDAEASRLMSEAFRLSNILADIECYAIRLSVEARGYDPADYSATLQHTKLTEADRALSKAEQQAKAEQLLFDAAYQSYKREIRDNITECERTLVGQTREIQTVNVARFRRTLALETVLIAVLLLTAVAIVVCTQIWIISPLNTLVKLIPSKQFLPEIGAAELRYMVHAYNDAYRQSKDHQERLTHEATHDSLTGLSNRKVFEQQRVNAHRRRQAMVLIDVDSFKQINDTYGHDTGDRVLKKVANALQTSFRAEDYVCRIGGDEFAVILQHTDRTMRAVIERKIESIRATLRDTSDGLPRVTLSIGVAFCDEQNRTEDLYKDADAAQYSIKNGGKNGYAFFDDVTSNSEPDTERTGKC